MPGRIARHLRANVVAYIALFFALGGGGGYALAATSSKTIHGCVVKRSGELLLRNKCSRGESKVAWNQRGPAGPRGKTGVTGATGPAGTTPYSAEGVVGINGGYDGTGFTSQPIATGEFLVTLTGPACSTDSPGKPSLVVTPRGNPSFPATTSGGSYDVADVAGTTVPGQFDVYTGEIVSGSYTPVDDSFNLVGAC